jgi:hypothetical protein
MNRHLAAAALAALAACGGAADPGVKVIVGAALIEGGAVVHERSAIVVEGAHIRAAGSQGDVPVPAGSEKSDATGQFAVSAGATPLRAGEPADLDFLACNPLEDASCRQQIRRSLRGGKWVSVPGVKQ